MVPRHISKGLPPTTRGNQHHVGNMIANPERGAARLTVPLQLAAASE
jgi:hypothetical protein